MGGNALKTPAPVTLRFYEPWERLLTKHTPDLQRMQQAFLTRGFYAGLMDLQMAWQEYSAEQLTDWYAVPEDDAIIYSILMPMMGAQE